MPDAVPADLADSCTVCCRFQLACQNRFLPLRSSGIAVENPVSGSPVDTFLPKESRRDAHQGAPARWDYARSVLAHCILVKQAKQIPDLVFIGTVLLRMRTLIVTIPGMFVFVRERFRFGERQGRTIQILQSAKSQPPVYNGSPSKRSHAELGCAKRRLGLATNGEP